MEWTVCGKCVHVAVWKGAKVSPAPLGGGVTHVSGSTRTNMGSLPPLFFSFSLWELGDAIALRAMLPNFCNWINESSTHACNNQKELLAWIQEGMRGSKVRHYLKKR